jgi:hypothetical protein
MVERRDIATAKQEQGISKATINRPLAYTVIVNQVDQTENNIYYRPHIPSLYTVLIYRPHIPSSYTFLIYRPHIPSSVSLCLRSRRKNSSGGLRRVQ